MKNHYIIPAIVMQGLLVIGSIHAAAEPPVGKEANGELSKLELLSDDVLLNVTSTLSDADLSHLMQASKTLHSRELLAKELVKRKQQKDELLIKYWSRPSDQYECLQLKGPGATEDDREFVYVYSATFSPDDKFIFAGFSAGDRVQQWLGVLDVSGTMLKQIPLPDKEPHVLFVEYQPDLSAKYEAPILRAIERRTYKSFTAKLWNLTTQKTVGKVERLASKSDVIKELVGRLYAEGPVFSPTRELYAQTASSDKTDTPRGLVTAVAPAVDLYDSKTHQHVGHFEIDKKDGCCSSISAIAFSPDGKIIAAGTSASSIYLWNIKTGECLSRLEMSDYGQNVGALYVNFLTFSHSGKMLIASANMDGYLCLWRAKDQR